MFFCTLTNIDLRFGYHKPLCSSGLLASFALPFLCSALLLATPVSAAEKEWRLEQNHGVSGNHVILLSPKAAKITNTTEGFEIVSKYPDWDIYSFRRDDKVICRVKRDAFFAQREYKERKDRNLPSQFHYVSEKPVGCLSAKIYRGGGDEIWIAKIPELPVQVEDLLIAYWKMSRIDGIPLRYTSVVSEPGLHTLTATRTNFPATMMDTKSCHTAPFQPSEFIIPSGFKPVRTDQIMTSAKRRNEAASIFSDMGLGVGFGAKKSK